MGCRFELLLDRAHGSLDPGAIEAVGLEIEELVLDWHARLSVFESGSITTRINSAQAGQSIAIDQEMYELCALCDRLRTISAGSFNIAAGTMMHALGFRDSAELDLDGLDLEHAITLDERRGTITRNDERVSIDFGAIAKGYVLDLARELLDEYGISNAFVHGGTSSAIALGTDPDGEAWSVRTGTVDLLVGLYGVGISEPTGREVIDHGERVGHVVDPRDHERRGKRLVGAGNQRATVVHESAAIADALSTVLCLDASLMDRIIENGIGELSCVVRGADGVDRVLVDRLGVVSGHGCAG
jgi:thiamine biosynthesis lipoprotein